MEPKRVFVRKIPRKHTEVHDYELKMRSNGTYPIYKIVPGARKTEDLVDPAPRTLQSAVDLILKGHPAEFFPNGPTYVARSVLRIAENNICVEYSDT
ncbi:MAG: hypothetical protein WBD01_09560 [Salaquimonas sp.]